MKALVTGSAGFIGFHVTKRLVDDGHAVVGLDALTPFYDGGLKRRRHAILQESERFRPVIGRLEDIDVVRQAVDLAEPDVIVHLAAQAGVRYSLESPRTYIESNIVGSWNLLEVAAEAKPDHLLLASTSSVYGVADTVPSMESARTDEPLSIYAASKKAMEALAHASAHLHALPTTAFRFFTVYGPWGRPDMAVFKFVDAIANGKPVEIYGDGTMKRDFTYIGDLVEALMRLIDVPPSPKNRVERPGIRDTLSPVAPFRVVNIGRGEPVGLLDFVDGIERLLGKPAQRKFLPVQSGDVPETHADPALLEALTGFRPSTSLDQGLGAFIDWYRSEYQANVSESASVAD